MSESVSCQRFHSNQAAADQHQGNSIETFWGNFEPAGDRLGLEERAVRHDHGGGEDEAELGQGHSVRKPGSSGLSSGTIGVSVAASAG